MNNKYVWKSDIAQKAQQYARGLTHIFLLKNFLVGKINA